LKTFEIISRDELDDIGLEGYITTTRRALAAKFGEPDETGTIDNKITTEWSLRFSDGTVANIYDWKRYDDDLGAPELDEVYQWHIGGQSKAAVYAVSGALGTGADIA
jgi:hypothetical protein